MSNILLIMNGVQEKMELFVNNEMMRVCASELGLDERCGYVYVNEDCIVVQYNYTRGLEYYGGFEYVDDEYKIRMGDFIVYMNEDDRVADAIAHFIGLEQKQEQS